MITSVTCQSKSDHYAGKGQEDHEPATCKAISKPKACMETHRSFCR
jgi:hypothetical protein